MSKAVVLFSGRGRHGAGNVEEKLIQAGVEVTRIEHDRASINKVPHGTLALVVLHDVVPPRVQAAIRDLATQAQVPLVSVERNWSSASTALRRAGIIESVEPEEEEAVIVQQPTPMKPVSSPAPQMAQLPSDVLEAVRLLADAMRGSPSVQFVTHGRNAGGLQVDFQVVNPTNGSILL